MLTANPDTQSLGGLGVASFVPFELTISVVAGLASGTAKNGAQTVNYTGVATDTNLELETSYTDAAGIDHHEVWTVQLSDADTFAGTMNETLSVLGIPFALTWNVTGTRVGSE